MTFWQVPSRGTKLRFHLQVDNITPKSRNKVLNTFNEWKLVCSGYDKQYEMFVFAKDFPDREDARQFIKDFPEPIKIKGYNGKDIKHF